MAKKNESDYQKAKRVKGYGFQYRSNKCITNLDLKRNHFINGNNKPVKTIEINSLQAYITEIDKLKGRSLTNTLFYRGHSDANWLLNPSVFRKNVSAEHQLINEFRRRFPSQLQNCHSFMDELVLMQHYGLHTRCLDITENPLAGLYFACADAKKYSDGKTNMNKWGEVIIFHVNEDNIDNIKYSDSSTVSIIANTAKMEETFDLLQLEIAFKNDNHYGSISNLINFKDIMNRSVIVRTKQDNPRIRNQSGAFILCNYNLIIGINGEFAPNNVQKLIYDEILKKSCDVDDVTEIISNNELLNKKEFEFINKINAINSDYWSFNFYKCLPYEKNEYINKILENDPFDLDKLYYKDNDEQVVFLIPPDAKPIILEQLDRFNINEEFIYPDMDSVSNELNLRIN